MFFNFCKMPYFFLIDLYLKILYYNINSNNRQLMFTFYKTTVFIISLITI